MEYRIPELLAIKARGEELTDDQIKYFVKSICDKSLQDAQLGKSINY